MVLFNIHKLPSRHSNQRKFTVDVFVEQLIVCELKAIDTVNPVWIAQILSHLKMTKVHVGFLINFNVSLIKQGIRRYCKE